MVSGSKGALAPFRINHIAIVLARNRYMIYPEKHEVFFDPDII